MEIRYKGLVTVHGPQAECARAMGKIRYILWNEGITREGPQPISLSQAGGTDGFGVKYAQVALTDLRDRIADIARAHINIKIELLMLNMVGCDPGERFVFESGKLTLREPTPMQDIGLMSW